MTATYKFGQPRNVAQVFDMKHVKSVSADVLIYNGQYAGRIVANWSDNPNGSVCTAVIHVFIGPLEDIPVTTGKAGGYGYDKLSSAVHEALAKVIGPDSGIELPNFGGAGMSCVREWFAKHGYELYSVIG